MTSAAATHRVCAAAIFDLDGVLVDTAPLHFEGWRRTAQLLGFTLPERADDQVRGVARDAALDIVLSYGDIEISAEQRVALAAEKNEWYVQQLDALDASALLPGALESLAMLRDHRIPIALASASRNARVVLERTGIADYFDAVVDGARTARAKPDPEVFLLAAADLGHEPRECAVVEDAVAGLEGAHAAGCFAIGIGVPTTTPHVDLVSRSLADVPWNRVFDLGDSVAKAHVPPIKEQS